MANYLATTDMTLEQAITNGSMLDGENLTIREGATVTCDKTPSILIGSVTIDYGKFIVDGVNITSGNMINFVGENNGAITVNGQGTFEVAGKWFDIGTTDGTDSQVIDMSSATGSNYWDGDFCVDVIPMIQIETGRRIDYDTESGTTPEVDDWLYKTSDRSVMGRIVQVDSTNKYIVVKFLTGSLADDDDIEVRKVVDNEGPDLQTSWTAKVNNVAGDIKEAGVYQEFGNSRTQNTSYIGSFHHGVGGFVFDHAFQSTSLTLGSSLGATGGFVPPSGCNIRVPNVHFSTSNLTNYASNLTYHDGTDNEGAWFNMSTNLAGTVVFDICNMGSAWFGCQNASSFTASYVGATIDMGANIAGSKVTYDHCVVVPDPMNKAYSIGWAFRTKDLFKGATMTDCMSIIPESAQQWLGCQTSNNVTINGCISTMACVATNRNYSIFNYYIFKSDEVTMDNNVAVGADYLEFDNTLMISQSSNVDVSNYKFSCTQAGIEQTEEKNAIAIANYATDILVKGIEVIDNGTPGNNVFNISDTLRCKVRCMGMIDDKIDLGVDGEYMVNLQYMCTDINVARMYKTGGEVKEFINIPNTTKDVLVQNCSGDYTSEIQPSAGDGTRLKGLHGGAGTPGSTTGWEDAYYAIYGNSFHDGFRSDTVGTLACLMITPSGVNDETTIVAGNPLFYKDGDLDMESGDIIEFEQSYFMKGHTGFPGTFTTCTGESAWNADEWTNVTLEFQWMLDGGAWNGTWLDVRTPANWTGITGTIEAGIKFKFRFTATGTQKDMSMLLIDTDTTITAQKNNLYPIDQTETDFTLLNVTVGSEYWIYNSDTSTLITSGTAVSDTVTYTAMNIPNGTNIKIRVRKYGLEPFEADAVVTDLAVVSYVVQDTDYTSADYATANAYTGIAVNHTTKTVTVSETHTIQDMYDYVQAYLVNNMDKALVLSTVAGTTFNFETDWNLTVTGTGVKLQEETKNTTFSGTGALTVASGALYEDQDEVIWENGGSNYYASHVYFNVVKASDSTAIENAYICWLDTATQTRLGYDTSLNLATLTTDASGNCEGYFVWKIDSTVYGNTKQTIGEYNHDFMVIPRSLSGSPLGSSSSRVVFRLAADDEVTLSKTDAGLITGITVDVTNDIIDLSDENLSDSYDNLKYQTANSAEIDTGIPGVMYYCLYGMPLVKGGTTYTGRSTSTIYRNFNGVDGVFQGGIVEEDTPGTYPSWAFNTAQINFEGAGTYDFRSSTFNNTITVDTIGDYTVLAKFPTGTTVTNNDAVNITVETSTSITISNANLADGTRARLYNVTQATEIDNVVVSGGAGYSYIATVGPGEEIEVGDTIRLTSAYNSGTTYYNETDESAVAGTSNIVFITTQTNNEVLNGYGIDGSLQTDFTADYPNIEVDINSGDTTRQKLLGWLAYTITTADGIRNFFGVITHEDASNAKINTSVVDLKLDYVGTGTSQFTDNIRLYRDDGTTIFGGTGDNFYATSGKVYNIETGVSGLTATESNQLALIDTVNTNVNWIKKVVGWLRSLL